MVVNRVLKNEREVRRRLVRRSAHLLSPPAKTDQTGEHSGGLFIYVGQIKSGQSGSVSPYAPVTDEKRIRSSGPPAPGRIVGKRGGRTRGLPGLQHRLQYLP